MANVPADLGLLSTYQRRDLDVSDAAHRPTDVDYARYVGLVISYRADGYDDHHHLLDRHAFAVECPSFNSILAGAELSLAQIAGVLGLAAEATAHRERAQRI